MNKLNKVIFIFLASIGFVLMLLLVSSAVASESTFRFRDCIKVNKGFYGGCAGRITGQQVDSEEDFINDDNGRKTTVKTYKYNVDGYCKGAGFSTQLLEAEMKPYSTCRSD